MAQKTALKAWVKKWEGGYSNHPNDLGHETNMGVTIATFRTFYGADRTVEELKNLTEEQWNYIFDGFWSPWKADQIKSQPIANICFDWGWASGAKTAIKQVQKLLGVAVDGIVGPKTLAAINAAEPRELFDKIKEARLAFVRDIVARNPSQARFSRGWTNRINDIKYE